MRIKALSLHNGHDEPWATWIAEGKKTIETRSWQTKYRGPILICATKEPEGPVNGMAVAVANLFHCRPMTPKDEVFACRRKKKGLFSLILTRAVAIPDPFPVQGRQGLFDVEEELPRGFWKILENMTRGSFTRRQWETELLAIDDKRDELRKELHQVFARAFPEGGVVEFEKGNGHISAEILRIGSCLGGWPGVWIRNQRTGKKYHLNGYHFLEHF